MRFSIPTRQKFDGRQLMLAASYHEHRDPYTGKMSFAKRAGGEGHYPRFHVYLTERSGEVGVDLHLDQKKPSYGGGTHAHAGEYDGRVVEEEGGRIQEVAARILAEPDLDHEPEPENQKGLFSKLFG